MDQNNDIFDLNSKCSISLNEVITYSSGNEKKKMARKRWAILAKALKSPSGSEPSSPTDEISVRRISSFMLLKTQQLPTVPLLAADACLFDQLKKRTWYKYTLKSSCCYLYTYSQLVPNTLVLKRIVTIKLPLWKKLFGLLFVSRADYWKSQDRKYCDFCKCWIADNKPSVEFHEKGRRHQENVKKRLRHITKNSERAQRESDRVDATLKHMESAALLAYRKDVQNNADMTSKAINKRLETDNLAISSGSKKAWHEAKSKEGQTYYWNTVTNETSWEAPNDGYLSLQEQKQENNDATTKHLKELNKHRQQEALLRLQERKKEEDEERARLAREKLKERRVVDDIPEPVYAPIIESGKNDPYGRWQTVKERAPLDLQLPEQQEYVEIPVEYEPEPVVREFKEKTVESLGGSGGTSFKKRKIGAGAKRNTRQRLDE